MPHRIVNMGSVFEATGAIGLYTRRLPWDDLKGSHLTDSGERPYCLSKTMLMMYSRVLAEKLRGSGVDVFAGGWVCGCGCVGVGAYRCVCLLPPCSPP
jgi:NAD(P)-dependent dehydrogenase (short-subunit alcohol dehydrogenase family)